MEMEMGIDQLPEFYQVRITRSPVEYYSARA